MPGLTCNLCDNDAYIEIFSAGRNHFHIRLCATHATQSLNINLGPVLDYRIYWTGPAYVVLETLQLSIVGLVSMLTDQFQCS